MLKDILGRRWVETSPKSSGAPALYEPDGPDLPLSRAPRKQFELHPDGTARLFVAGPADRLEELPAEWEEQGGDIVIRSTGGRTRAYRVVEQKPDQLMVRE